MAATKHSDIDEEAKDSDDDNDDDDDSNDDDDDDDVENDDDNEDESSSEADDEVNDINYDDDDVLSNDECWPSKRFERRGSYFQTTYLDFDAKDDRLDYININN